MSTTPTPEGEPVPLSQFLRGRFSSRADSIVPVAGKEGTKINRHQCSGKTMAVFTSGGDAPGLSSLHSFTIIIYQFI